jgi:hypothetical protein
LTMRGHRGTMPVVCLALLALLQLVVASVHQGESVVMLDQARSRTDHESSINQTSDQKRRWPSSWGVVILAARCKSVCTAVGWEACAAAQLRLISIRTTQRTSIKRINVKHTVSKAAQKRSLENTTQRQHGVPGVAQQQRPRNSTAKLALGKPLSSQS